jgi:uncharacterized repeat protein (TIGR03803 family)
MSRLGNLARLLFFASLNAAPLVMMPPAASAADTYTVIHEFRRNTGTWPSGPLIADAAGNLYGVTAEGGSKNCKHGRCGVVYRLATDGTYKVLYAFQGGSDGRGPSGNLLLDASGNLYGTTGGGGKFKWGTAYKLAPDGSKTTLHSFAANPTDGAIPHAGLIADMAGNLYGTTAGGGVNGFQGGTVFKITPDGTETVLYSFCSATNCADGHDPEARLLLDGAGNLYGTTVSGGQFNQGTVFRVANNGVLGIVYSFGAYSDDAAGPEAGLIADSAGNLYGTTRGGGSDDAGTVFKIAADGSETLLHQFHFNSTDGAEPQAEVLLDGRGDLFGTTFQDGSLHGGTIFEIDSMGVFAVLHNFSETNGEGSEPNAGLVSLNRRYYGVAQYGGRGCSDTGCGVIYSLKP